MLGNPRCPRRADKQLLYISCQTSKNNFARPYNHSILCILTSFRTGQRGRRSDVSSFTLRSRVLNHQSLCPIVHSRHCLVENSKITFQTTKTSPGDPGFPGVSPVSSGSWGPQTPKKDHPWDPGFPVSMGYSREEAFACSLVRWNFVAL